MHNGVHLTLFHYNGLAIGAKFRKLQSGRNMLNKFR